MKCIRINQKQFSLSEPSFQELSVLLKVFESSKILKTPALSKKRSKMSVNLDKTNPNNPSNDREGRLKLRKNNEEVLRKVLQADARKKCLEETNAFGECAKDNGLMVVLKCREKNTVMQNCLTHHYNDKTFDAFLQENGHPPARATYTLVDRFKGWLK